jgi:SAM-dependent methyltransferase
MAKYELLLGWLGDIRGQSVLVAGCGSGELACLLAARGASVTAFDVDEATVELTRQAARAANVHIETRVAGLTDYADPQRYDAVIATDVLEHIEDDRAAAARLVALTRPDGRVVITVPAIAWLFGYHDEILGHYRRYDRRTLRLLFDGSLRIEHLRSFGFILIPVALLFSRLLRRPYPTAQVGVAAGTRRSPLGAFIRAAFHLEKRIPAPLGTSLLMIGRR